MPRAKPWRARVEPGGVPGDARPRTSCPRGRSRTRRTIRPRTWSRATTSKVGTAVRQQQQRHQRAPADAIGEDAERQAEDRAAEHRDRRQPGELDRSRCSSALMGTPSTPNISQTANSRVKATVERARTRVGHGTLHTQTPAAISDASRGCGGSLILLPATLDDPLHGLDRCLAVRFSGRERVSDGRRWATARFTTISVRRKALETQVRLHMVDMKTTKTSRRQVLKGIGGAAALLGGAGLL